MAQTQTSQARRGGILFLQINGELQDAKGEFTYNLGTNKRTAIVGSSSVTGYSEEPQVPFIEGKITDRKNLDVKALTSITDATVTVRLAVGKTVMLRGAWFAGEGNVASKEGEIDVRFEGISAEEV